MNLDEITPLVLTYNEEANIERTLSSLPWARRTVVIDSGSTDGTAEIVAKHTNTSFVQRTFDNHTSQWNFGLEQIQTPWVLALDADYVCPSELQEELNVLSPVHDAYQACFRYCILGHPLRGTLYPPRVVLFRVAGHRYTQDGHTQTLQTSQPVGELQSVLLHDDRKSLARWLYAQSNYAKLEAAKILSTPTAELSWKDRLRKHVLWAPPLTLFYCLVCKGLILDGWPGIYYTLQRVYAELLLSLKLIDQKLRGS